MKKSLLKMTYITPTPPHNPSTDFLTPHPTKKKKETIIIKKREKIKT